MKQASSKRSREGFPDGPDTDFDVSTYYSTISSGVQAAVRLEELAGCAALRVDVAVSELLFAVSTVMASLSDARMQLVFTLRTLLRVRGKALDHALEELDGCEKQLLACARVCAAGGMYDPHLAWESANGSISLIYYDTFPRVSLFVDAGLFAWFDACTAFTACVRVSDGELGPARSLWGGSGLKYCELGTAPSALCHNKVTLLCVDALGDRLRGLRPDYFHVSIKVEGAHCDASVKDVTVKDDVLEFAYSVSNAAEEAAPTGGNAGQVTITVLCFGALITSPAIPVGGSITGRYSKTLMARERGSNLAIAISADGTIMAISTDFSDRIHFAIALYSLPDGVLLLECGERGGGPTQLGSPHMLCFSPRDNNLLICDSENGRVQEFTTAGCHVRAIGEGVIRECANGIAASADVIVVGSEPWSQSEVQSVLIFEADSCALIRSIEVFGKGVGQISTIAALRFTPDGKHIAIVDDFSNGVLFFSLNGEYVSCIDGGDSGDSLGALDCPMDADFALNGDIVIADGENHRVCVFSPSGNLRHHFGSYGEDPGCFMTPSALAVHGNTLYVVEWGSGRVQVFS